LNFTQYSYAFNVSTEIHDKAVNQDKAFCWHPFTRQSEWCDSAHEPIMIDRAKGVWLFDTKGNRYLDGNASIWTNIHGHQRAEITNALQNQLNKVAHSSYLGAGHPLASELAERLVSFFPNSSLNRVFYSDNGSTAVECALKMALQYRMQSGGEKRDEFVAFHSCYHGDTMGAASLGGVDTFFARFRKLGMKVNFVADLDELKNLPSSVIDRIAGVVIEPLVQGVNQIHVWEEGMLKELRAWTQEHNIHLILDEVMTGFGRTGEMFACNNEGVVPDFLCLAKGLTGGYLPLAATLVTEEIYNAFLGSADKAFYYGHSYTANPLGCAAALASLEIFRKEQTLVAVREKSMLIGELLNLLKSKSPFIHEVRRCGMVSGIELRHEDGGRFPKDRRMGEKVCNAARVYGLLTRPILDTIVFLPPLSITRDEISFAFSAIESAILDVFPR